MPGLPFCILIPTRDSGRWVAHFLRAYRKLGIEPFYIVDPRSSDDTEDLLKSAGAAYRCFEPKGSFIEAGTLAFAAEVAQEDWILRLDDDEFPSAKLLEWAKLSSFRKKRAWGLSRLNLFRRGDAIYFNQNARVFDQLQGSHINNPQFRFYDKSSVQYNEALHTPGFVLKDWAYAPPDAYIAHFDALLKPLEERLEKVKRYENTKRGYGWVHSDQYLPEFLTLEELEASPYTGGLSEFIEDLPVAPPQEKILISCEDIRNFHASNKSREAHALRLTFEARSDFASKLARLLPQAVATVSVGEFVCTIGRGLRVLGLQTPINALGSAIFERAKSEKMEKPPTTAKMTGPSN